MKPALETWEWRNPLDVAQRRELQDNAKAQRERARLTEGQAKLAEQQRIRNKVFKTGVK